MPLLPGLRRRVGMLLDERVRRVGHVRHVLATRYLKGEGIEIGALHKPLPMPRGARVRYVDRMSAADLRRHYPELASWDLVDPDIIDDGERLETVADDSLDFVVANHFIEHTEDPLGAIANHLRVLKPGGVLFMGVPEKRMTFDRDREITTIDHLLRDHREGPQGSRGQHYEEWARDVDHASDVAGHAQALMDQSYSIHFHVWTCDAFRQLLEHARTHEHIPFSIEQVVENGFEFIVILRKTDPSYA